MSAIEKQGWRVIWAQSSGFQLVLTGGDLNSFSLDSRWNLDTWLCLASIFFKRRDRHEFFRDGTWTLSRFSQEILRHDSWHCWKLLWKFNELFARFKLKSNNFPWVHYFEFLKPLILSNILVLITVAKICWKPLTPTDQYIEQTNKCTKCSDAVFPLPDNKCHMQCSFSWNDCPRSLPLEMHSTPLSLHLSFEPHPLLFCTDRSYFLLYYIYTLCFLGFNVPTYFLSISPF